MRPVRALLLNILWVSALFGGGHALAQETIPQTPPELRDFRLDPQRPQPEAEPQPITPPPVVSTVPDQQAEPETPARTQPIRRQPAAGQPAASAEPETAPQAGPEPVLPTPAQAEPVLPETALVEADSPAEDSWNYGLIGGIGLAVLAAVLGLWLALKRRRQRPEERAYDEPDIEPAPQAVVQPTAPPPIPSPPIPSPIAKPIAANRPEPAKQPGVALAFTPEKATVSFTTLSIRGQLQIANDSVEMARDMQLRAGLISASNEQQQAMSAFFAAPDIMANPLGEAKPGERLAMAIELTVPLTEMHSFPMGDQRLLVPIMVAELAYKSEDGTEQQTRIAAMLGREAKPPQPKMGPLRLDQGPRSFAPLGQRPLAA